MNLYSFLEIDKRYCVYILEILSSKGNKFLSITQLMDILGISKFKVLNYLEEIREELVENHLGSEIIIYPTNEIDSVNLDGKDVKVVRLNFLESSIYFQLFKEVLSSEKGINTEEMMNKFYLTKKKYYEERKVFIGLIKENLKFKKNRLQGDEQEIRLFSLGVLYFFYNDIRFPFPEIEHIVRIFVDKLSMLFQIKMTRTMRTKLELYIAVCFIRIKSKSYMKDTLLEESAILRNQEALFVLSNWLKKEFPVEQSFIEIEAQNILQFLLVEEYIKRDQLILDFVQNSNQQELTETFLDILKEESLIDFSQFSPQEESDLFNELNRIHLKMGSFFIESTTFIEPEQVKFFEESYPVYTRVILSFFKKVPTINGLELDEKIRVNLFYNYMFVLINIIPRELISDKVYICVDFLQGTMYSDYISSSLKYFSNLNIEIEHNVSMNTDIYLSDFLSDKLNCYQVIWKSPPIGLDWQHLGDLIVKVKGEKYV